MARSKPRIQPVPAPSLDRVQSRLRMRHLLFIEALAKRGNIRQAAADLFMSQPAASKLLKELEYTFEVQLYERGPHGITPTPSSEALLFWSRRVIANLSAARDELQAIRSGYDGRVRVGVFPVGAPLLLPRAIATLRARQTDVQLSVREGLEDTLLPALKRGELDCVVGRLTTESRSRTISYELLHEEPTAVVSGPKHPLARRWLPATLDNYRWMLPSEIAALHALVANGLAAIGAAPPKLAVQTSSVLMIVKALQSTDLLSAIPLAVARDFAASGMLAVLPVAMSTTLHPVCIMTPSGWPASAATAAFLDALRQASREGQRRPQRAAAKRPRVRRRRPAVPAGSAR